MVFDWLEFNDLEFPFSAPSRFRFLAGKILGNLSGEIEGLEKLPRLGRLEGFNGLHDPSENAGSVNHWSGRDAVGFHVR